MEFVTFYKKAQKHEFQMMHGIWGGSAAYDNPQQLWGVENWENQGYNFTGFGDASSDSLLNEININLFLYDFSKLSLSEFHLSSPEFQQPQLEQHLPIVRSASFLRYLIISFIRTHLLRLLNHTFHICCQQIFCKKRSLDRFTLLTNLSDHFRVRI